SYAALQEHAHDVLVDIEKLLGACPPGVRIAVDAARSATTVATYLACIQQSWSYVPIPDGAPQQRCDAILSSADPVARVTPTDLATGYELTRLGSVGRAGVEDDVMAVLHTSGSTGTPKGVRITSDNLA